MMRPFDRVTPEIDGFGLSGYTHSFFSDALLLNKTGKLTPISHTGMGVPIPVSHDQQHTLSNGAYGAFFTPNIIFYSCQVII